MKVLFQQVHHKLQQIDTGGQASGSRKDEDQPIQAMPINQAPVQDVITGSEEL